MCEQPSIKRYSFKVFWRSYFQCTSVTFNEGETFFFWPTGFGEILWWEVAVWWGLSKCWSGSKKKFPKIFGTLFPSGIGPLGERILRVWYWKPHFKNRFLSALRAGENVVFCQTPEKGSLFQFLPFSQSLGERQPNVYCEDLGQKGLTTMYQLLGPLGTSREKVLTSLRHV